MHNAYLTLIGGSALLVYAVESLAENIQNFAGHRTRTWINVFAGNRLYALILGFVLAVIMGSSGAVTAMLVGLANARLLTLEQVLAVTLGAIVGSTLIVQVMAFDASHYAMVLISIGVSITFFTSSESARKVSRVLLFLGLMFLSMMMVRDAGIALQGSNLFQQAIGYFKDRPFASLLLSTYLTALVHSSAAVIALVMALLAGEGGLAATLPWVLGANLGTTSTGFLAGYRGGILGKQAALAHFLVKVVGIAICYPLLDQFAALVELFGHDIQRQVANAHTAFNLFLALLFFPFLPLGVRFVRRMIPEKDSPGLFSFFYIDPRSLKTPELALAQAHREILRLSDYVEEMVEKCITLFESRDQQAIDELRGQDKLIDFLNKGIKMHLTKLSQQEMTAEQVHREFELLFRTNDLESIGDVVEKNIIPLVKKNIKKGYEFSDEGWSEIVAFHAKVLDCLKLSTAYFASSDRSLSVKLALLSEELEEMMVDLSERHVKRLHKGVKETMHTSSVHMDLIGCLHRIATLAVNFTRLPDLRAE